MINYHHAIQVRCGEIHEIDDPIVVEDRFQILFNDHFVTEMIASRHQLMELGAGFVISEGLSKFVDKVIIDGDRILVYSDVGCEMNMGKRAVGSSGGLEFFKKPAKVVSDITLSCKEIITITGEIETELWRKTGGVHCSVLYHKGSCIAKSSDVGRHNTVDKVIGHALLNGIDLSHCIIGCTGRQPAGMVRKNAHAGIPIIISRAASTDKGIAAAEAAGITLVCFSRGERFTVYTHPERIRDFPVSPPE